MENLSFYVRASFLFMFPVTFYAESKNKFDRAILLGVGFLLFSFILIMGGIYQLNFWLIAASLVLFFRNTYFTNIVNQS